MAEQILRVQLHDKSVELESLREEWQTSEELLAGSQKDNEEKHLTIERMKAYIKVRSCSLVALKQKLERLAEDACGPSWRTDHDIAALNPVGPVCNASTPLPKPALRSSVSLTASRRSTQRRHVSQQDKLSLLRDIPEIQDSTPTAQRGLGKPLMPTPTKDNATAEPIAQLLAIEQKTRAAAIATLKEGEERLERQLAELKHNIVQAHLKAEQWQMAS